MFANLSCDFGLGLRKRDAGLAPAHDSEPVPGRIAKPGFRRAPRTSATIETAIAISVARPKTKPSKPRGATPTTVNTVESFRMVFPITAGSDPKRRSQ
jgi:hypothetical protein